MYNDHPYVSAMDSTKKMPRLNNGANDYHNHQDDYGQFVINDKRFSKDRYINPLITEQDLFDNNQKSERELSELNQSHNFNNLFAPTPPLV